MNALSDNDKKRTLPKLSSTIDFLNIYPNIDLQYEVNPNDIKENIIIKEKVDNPLFIFNLDTKGLIPKLLEDNSIGFYDASNPEKVIFSMDAPYMYDALNEQSKDIVLTLEPVGKGYSLRVQPNNEWLSSSDRQFPIIIDPTLQTKQETSNIKIMFPKDFRTLILKTVICSRLVIRPGEFIVPTLNLICQQQP